jgi:DNA-binding response OmpR family regulator
MGQKILVVDDEPDVVAFQRDFLKRKNFSVLTATNSNEAIELIKRESPDIVFCDLRLDSESAGLDILVQARAIKPNIIFYILSGLVDREIEEKGLALGAKEILAKPISLEKMIERIR